MVVPVATRDADQSPYRPQLGVGLVLANERRQRAMANAGIAQHRLAQIGAVANFTRQLDALKANTLAGSASAKWLATMEKQRASQIGAVANFTRQLATLKVAHALAAGQVIAVPSLAHDSVPVAQAPHAALDHELNDEITTRWVVLSLLPWYASLTPKHRRAVSDAALAVLVGAAYFLSDACDSRPLELMADGLGVLLGLMILFSRALDTFDD